MKKGFALIEMLIIIAIIAILMAIAVPAYQTCKKDGDDLSKIAHLRCLSKTGVVMFEGDATEIKRLNGAWSFKDKRGNSVEWEGECIKAVRQ